MLPVSPSRNAKVKSYATRRAKENGERMTGKSDGVGFDAEGMRHVPEEWARGGRRASEPAVVVSAVEDESRVG